MSPDLPRAMAILLARPKFVQKKSRLAKEITWRHVSAGYDLNKADMGCMGNDKLIGFIRTKRMDALAILMDLLDKAFVSDAGVDADPAAWQLLTMEGAWLHERTRDRGDAVVCHIDCTYAFRLRSTLPMTRAEIPAPVGEEKKP